MPAAVALVPSSKGKAAGGRGAPYGRSAALRHAGLGSARTRVLDALVDAAGRLDDAGIRRLCACRDDEVDDHRARLRRLPEAPTRPARARYTGVVHANAGLAEAGGRGLDVGMLGGLLGVAWSGEPVPDYRIEVTGRVPDLGVLGTWWREALAEHLRSRARGRRVWDLLPGEHARMWPARRRGELEVVRVAFRRPDGRAAPTASAKLAKGRLLRLLLEEPTLGPDDLRGGRVIEGWRLEADDDGLVAVQAV